LKKCWISCCLPKIGGNSPGDESVQPLDPAQPPIWESFEEFAEQLPADISATLPTDGAAQIDHYLYGSPKHD
jgi:hypothetical protein